MLYIFKKYLLPLVIVLIGIGDAYYFNRLMNTEFIGLVDSVNGYSLDYLFLLPIHLSIEDIETFQLFLIIILFHLCVFGIAFLYLKKEFIRYIVIGAYSLIPAFLGVRHVQVMSVETTHSFFSLMKYGFLCFLYPFLTGLLIISIIHLFKKFILLPEKETDNKPPSVVPPSVGRDGKAAS